MNELNLYARSDTGQDNPTVYAEFYQDSLLLLEIAASRVLTVLEQARQTRVRQSGHDPVEHLKARIKSPASMKEKLQRCHYPVDLRHALNQVHDAVGIRLVCTFIQDIYQIALALEAADNFSVHDVKDYIKRPKANGYRSYHMIVRVPFKMGEQTVWIYVEIQLRTLAMDFWASLEHHLRYKQEIPEAQMFEAELRRCADEIATTDLNFQTIRDLVDSGMDRTVARQTGPNQTGAVWVGAKRTAWTQSNGNLP